MVQSQLNGSDLSRSFGNASNLNSTAIMAIMAIIILPRRLGSRWDRLFLKRSIRLVLFFSASIIASAATTSGFVVTYRLCTMMNIDIEGIARFKEFKNEF